MLKYAAIVAHTNKPNFNPISSRATNAEIVVPSLERPLMIPFNKPVHVGTEILYVTEAIRSGHISGNGPFSRKCCRLLENKFRFRKVFLTPSCTSALEMAALLCDFREGDEVILPSFAHVGTVNAFVRCAANVVLADSLPGHPNVDPDSVKSLLGPRTRAIVALHYAGLACEMETLQALARAYNLFLIEDAAHALGASYLSKNLGAWSDFGAVSFHETKNITSGLGGMLVVNRPDMIDRATRIWNQGTNRQEFEEGRAPFYTWIEPGASFQLSDLNAAHLYAQLLQFDEIAQRRLGLWQAYYDRLLPLQERGYFRLPKIQQFAQHNGHIFYLLMNSTDLRDRLIGHLQEQGYQAVFHYIPLHESPWIRHSGTQPDLPNSVQVANCIVRLPLFDRLTNACVAEIVESIKQWLDLLP